MDVSQELTTPKPVMEMTSVVNHPRPPLPISHVNPASKNAAMPPSNPGGQPPAVKKYFRRGDGCIVRKSDGAVVKLADGTIVKNPVPSNRVLPQQDQMNGVAQRPQLTQAQKEEILRRRAMKKKAEELKMQQQKQETSVNAQILKFPSQLVKDEPVKRKVVDDSDDDVPLMKRKVVDDSDDDVPLMKRSKPEQPQKKIERARLNSSRKAVEDSDSDVPIKRHNNKLACKLSDEDSDSDVPIRRRIQKEKVKVKKEVVKSPKKVKVKREVNSDDEENEVDDADQQAQMNLRQQKRSSKEKVVAQFLARWWYALPDWPPVNFDYTESLAENGIREVRVCRFEDEAEEKDGLKKAYQLCNFPGIFRDCDEKIYDLRPKDSCPSFGNMMKKSESELWTLLHTAASAQLEQYRASPFKACIIGGAESLENLVEKAKFQMRK